MYANRLHLSESTRDGVVIVTVGGDLIAESEGAPFRRRIARLVKRGAGMVVVDLSKANRVGAAMLGELIRGLTSIRDAGGDLKLSGVSGRLERILRTTRLSGIFKTADVGTLTPDADHGNVKKVA